jgi:hypothetical protein
LPSNSLWRLQRRSTARPGHHHWQNLAIQARDLNWSHEEYLNAVLERGVADRESAGTIARFPAVKTLEEFSPDHFRTNTRAVGISNAR